MSQAIQPESISVTPPVRTPISWRLSLASMPTSEALQTLSMSVGGATATTGTSFQPTSGKKLRIQEINWNFRLTSGANFGHLKFRWSDTGDVTTSSPVFAEVNLQTVAAGDGVSGVISFPDGFELSGTMEWGVSGLSNNASVAFFSATVVGYEY